MRIPIYQVDAFSARPFAGNPAAVCPLKVWLDDALLQAIAAENSLPETAYLAAEEGRWRLRWFTPATEVDLCGHATLAAAFVLWERLGVTADRIAFATRSGLLAVVRDGEWLALDFPSRPPLPCPAPPGLIEALGQAPEEVYQARDLMAVYAREEQVRALEPDMARLAQIAAFGIIVTAPGEQADFVSRFFAPAQGIPEDPVTGSSHCTLIPYWSRRLGKNRLYAQQLSARGGELRCEDRGERVSIAGRAVLVMEGTLLLPDTLPTEG